MSDITLEKYGMGAALKEKRLLSKLRLSMKIIGIVLLLV